MTTTVRDGTVEERLDRLSAQVDYLVGLSEQDQLRRRAMSELSHDMAPVAREAMATVAGRLDAADISLDEAMQFLVALAQAMPVLERALGQVESLSELMQDASGLSGSVMGSLTERFAEMDRRGYVEFARSGLGVVDRIVTSYSEDDVEALGENIVLILDTVKEMTQPEVMGMLRRTFHTVSEAEEPPEPPSLFSLLREMRDPQTRRGLARVLTMLRSVGEDTPVTVEN